MVEDTPAVLSGNSSLSELSVDSDIDPSDNALLEECINAAMPKSKPNKQRKKSSRQSPNGMGGKSRSKTNDTTAQNSDNAQQPKNVKVPQSNQDNIEKV